LSFNVGSLRCEPRSTNLSNIHPQANKENKNFGQDLERDWQSDKSEKFKVLEWLIMQSLLQQYGKLDADAELAELPD
jgi:hypothetical protein